METATEVRDPKGRKLRKDAQVMLAGVVSFPIAASMMTEEDRLSYAVWEADNLNWLTEKFGVRLKSVLRHEDEEHFHLHFLVVPNLLKGERIESVHPGREAIAQAKQGGCTSKKILDQCYRKAMRELQNCYYKEVGSPNGLTRFGPRRRRLTRAAWQQEQTQAKLLSDVILERESDQKKITALTVALHEMQSQACQLLGAVMSPSKILLPQRPEWLALPDWQAIQRRVTGSLALFKRRQEQHPEKVAPAKSADFQVTR